MCCVCVWNFAYNAVCFDMLDDTVNAREQPVTASARAFSLSLWHLPSLSLFLVYARCCHISCRCSTSPANLTIFQLRQHVSLFMAYLHMCVSSNKTLSAPPPSCSFPFTPLAKRLKSHNGNIGTKANER